MKKLVIYILLSLILVAPIAVIAAIGIMNSGGVTYTYPDRYSNDFSELMTEELTTGTVEEEVSAYGTLTNVRDISLSVDYGDESDVRLTHEPGDYLKAGDTVCTVDGTDYQAECDCVITDVREYNNAVEFKLQPTKVTTVEATLSDEYYCYVKNSSASFRWGETEYTALPCTGAAEHASSDGNTFLAYYDIDGSDLLFGGTVELTVKTGRIAENVLVVPESYLFRENNGHYYVEVLLSDGIKNVYVSTGISGGGMVQIIPEEEAELSAGNTLVENSINVFAENKKPIAKADDPADDMGE